MNLNKALESAKTEISNLNQTVQALKSVRSCYCLHCQANLILESRLKGGMNMNDSRMDTMSIRSRAYDDQLSQCNSSTYISPRRRRETGRISSRMSNGTMIRSSRGSVRSGYSNNSSGSVILKVISGARSNASYSSLGSTYSKSSTILKKGGRRHAPKSRRDNMSVRSGRSNFQIVDGDSEAGDDDVISKHSTYIKRFDVDEGPGTSGKFNLQIEEVKEDEEDKDSMYDKGGFSDYSASNGDIIINFETMFENVREYEPDFKDSVDYCITYKARVSYINIHKAEPEIVESYMILTKKYLYIYEVKEDGEYPLVFTNGPVKTDDMGTV